MAAFETTRVHQASAGQFGQFFSALISNVISWYEVRKTRAALSKLSDRELEDIGLLRRDIHSIT
ncbi:DUF1127 domain-containing protein [Cognatishimia maritima]|uniref:YjiS-like domain-containing protein n=1 Tax=Cognatishimia maritima TaxID=870908 RepID=A0A1M5KG86_9RHOB|nr:DUF1127 domain-containing protein [Cognatishimia maritima]SHG51715.1 protein of unknown function [Cognatishimia maritima]